MEIFVIDSNGIQNFSEPKTFIYESVICIIPMDGHRQTRDISTDLSNNPILHLMSDLYTSCF